jgi:hypothetical protein
VLGSPFLVYLILLAVLATAADGESPLVAAGLPGSATAAGTSRAGLIRPVPARTLRLHAAAGQPGWAASQGTPSRAAQPSRLRLTSAGASAASRARPGSRPAAIPARRLHPTRYGTPATVGRGAPASGSLRAVPARPVSARGLRFSGSSGPRPGAGTAGRPARTLSARALSPSGRGPSRVIPAMASAPRGLRFGRRGLAAWFGGLGDRMAGRGALPGGPRPAQFSGRVSPRGLSAPGGSARSAAGLSGRRGPGQARRRGRRSGFSGKVPSRRYGFGGRTPHRQLGFSRWRRLLPSWARRGASRGTWRPSGGGRP